MSDGNISLWELPTDFSQPMPKEPVKSCATCLQSYLGTRHDVPDMSEHASLQGSTLCRTCVSASCASQLPYEMQQLRSYGAARRGV